jgi:predicted dienelactone hydrolase
MAHRYAILTVLVFCLAFSTGLKAVPQQGESTNFNETGPFKVSTVDSLDLADAKREKNVTVKVYYPEGEGPFPVIVFSSSLRGNKDRYPELARHWTSHGYVLVHPTHDDTGVEMVNGGMHPPGDKVLDRLRDVTAVLDGFDQLERVPALRGKLDRNRIGVGGHSYGSYITMTVGGAISTVGQDRKKLADPRVKCVVPIAMAGPGEYGLDEDSWKSLTIPTLFIGGTQDLRVGRPDNWRFEGYRLSPTGNKYLVVIEGANHGAYGESGPGNDAPRYVKAAATAFWDACLRGSEKGKAYLSGDGFRRFAGNAATISAK